MYYRLPGHPGGREVCAGKVSVDRQPWGGAPLFSPPASHEGPRVRLRWLHLSLLSVREALGLRGAQQDVGR